MGRGRAGTGRRPLEQQRGQQEGLLGAAPPVGGRLACLSPWEVPLASAHPLPGAQVVGVTGKLVQEQVWASPKACRQVGSLEGFPFSISGDFSSVRQSP